MPASATWTRSKSACATPFRPIPATSRPSLRLVPFLGAEPAPSNEQEGTHWRVPRHVIQAPVTIRRILGELYEQHSNKPKLLETANQLRQIGNGPAGSTHRFAAAMYRAGGAPAKAADDIRSYVKAKPDDTDAQIALAQNLIAANRAEEARPVLEALKA